jgi:nucleotide-binding universal stress UspA family protein
MQVQRVLCPVDLSDPSLRALHHAAALATHHGATLYALHVVPDAVPPVLPLILAMPLAPAGDVPDQVVRTFEAFLARAALRRPPIAMIRQGAVVAAIVDYAVEIAADLLVLGSHGREGVQHVLFGSTAERVLQKAPCPTLVVPFHAGDVGSADTERFGHLLCATDFSPASTRALALAVAMAREQGAALTVLHVVEALAEDEIDDFPHVSLREHVRVLTCTARAQLRAAVPRESHGWGPVTEVVRYGDAAYAILREATERGADLIVLGAQGHSGLGLLVLGSSTHAVIRRATCPVLTTRA